MRLLSCAEPYHEQQLTIPDSRSKLLFVTKILPQSQVQIKPLPKQTIDWL